MFETVHTAVFIHHVHWQYCRRLESDIPLPNYTVWHPSVIAFNALRLLLYIVGLLLISLMV